MVRRVGRSMTRLGHLRFRSKSPSGCPPTLVPALAIGAAGE